MLGGLYVLHLFLILHLTVQSYTVVMLLTFLLIIN